MLSKIVQLEAKVPQQETLMVALNHILKLKEVVGEKMNQLGQKDTQLETKMNELDQRDSQLENKLNELQSVRELILKRVLELETATEESPIQTDSLEFLNRSSRTREHAERSIRVILLFRPECTGSIPMAKELGMTPSTFTVT